MKFGDGTNDATERTEVQFKIADLNFKSTSYDLLVIAGTKAQYKGTGTPDRFRIKIWDKVTGELICNNMQGASGGANPETALGGGSIVIHT